MGEEKPVQLSEVKARSAVFMRRMQGDRLLLPTGEAFELRALTGPQQLLIDTLMLSDYGAAMIATVRVGLTGWANLCDELGLALEYEKEWGEVLGQEMEVTAMKCLSWLPSELINKLAARILEISRLSREDRLRLGFTSPARRMKPAGPDGAAAGAEDSAGDGADA